MAGVLSEVAVEALEGPLTREHAAFIEEGLRRAGRVDCFDFVPSSYERLHAVLAALGRGRFCEWGSGMGIGVGLAEGLGYDACGIEIHPELAAASRVLLADFGLRAEIATGSYFDLEREADVYFVYCWPGQKARTVAHFLETTPEHATLLVCEGASDLRVKRKTGRGSPRR